MNRAVILVSDYTVQKMYILESEKDIEKTFEEMIEKVKRDKNTPCSISTIPREYFEEAGLNLADILVLEYTDQILVHDSLCEKGIEIARCRHCSSFDEGSCFHYGGICNPNTEMSECTHGHSCQVKRLCYDGDILEYVHLDKDLSPETVALALKETDENISSLIEDEDYDKSLWTLTKTE